MNKSIFFYCFFLFIIFNNDAFSSNNIDKEYAPIDSNDSNNQMIPVDSRRIQELEISGFKEKIESVLKRVSDFEENDKSLKVQISKQDYELNIWRERANINLIISQVIAALSFTIALISCFITVIGSKLYKEFRDVKEFKNQFEQWKRLQFVMTEIQMSIIDETMNDDISKHDRNDFSLGSPPPPVTTDTPQFANRAAWEISSLLQRIASADVVNIENLGNWLIQLLDLAPETRPLVRDYLYIVVGSELIESAKINQQIKNLIAKIK